jgi:hypothetical protein
MPLGVQERRLGGRDRIPRAALLGGAQHEPLAPPSGRAPVARLVGDDLQDPRAKGGARAEPPERGVGLQEGVLSRLLGVGGRPRDEPGRAEGDRLVLFHELSVGAEVASLGERNELRLVQWPVLHRAGSTALGGSRFPQGRLVRKARAARRVRRPHARRALLRPGGAVARRFADQRPGGELTYRASPSPPSATSRATPAAPLRAAPLRKAIAAAIGRPALATFRGATPTAGLLPATVQSLASPAADRSTQSPAPTHERRGRLTMAGVRGCDRCERIASAVASALRPLGLSVAAVAVADPHAAIRASRRRFDLVDLGTSFPYPDSRAFLARMLGGDVPAAWLPATTQTAIAQRHAQRRAARAGRPPAGRTPHASGRPRNRVRRPPDRHTARAAPQVPHLEPNRRRSGPGRPLPTHRIACPLGASVSDSLGSNGPPASPRADKCRNHHERGVCGAPTALAPEDQR